MEFTLLFIESLVNIGNSNIEDRRRFPAGSRMMELGGSL